MFRYEILRQEKILHATNNFFSIQLFEPEIIIQVRDKKNKIRLIKLPEKFCKLCENKIYRGRLVNGGWFEIYLFAFFYKIWNNNELTTWIAEEGLNDIKAFRRIFVHRTHVAIFLGKS